MQISKSIYVVLNRMVFYIPESEIYGAKPFEAILRRHVSYFGDIPGLEGLLHHIGGQESAYYTRLMEIIWSISGDNPREPFELWEPVDPVFKNLLGVDDEHGSGEKDFCA